MIYSDAINLLTDRKITRSKWEGAYLQYEYKKGPQVVVKVSENGEVVEWMPSQTDVMADDWIIME